MTKEIWKPIPGLNGEYEVSNLGNIVSLKFGKRRPMKQTMRKGYKLVTFRTKGKKVGGGVHTFVAKTFLGPVPDGHEVDHKDTNKTNNAAKNLEYVTHDENMKRATRNGCIKILGEDRAGSVLTKAIVLRAREEKHVWGGLSRMSRELGICRSSLQAAASGRTYKHI